MSPPPQSQRGAGHGVSPKKASTRTGGGGHVINPSSHITREGGKAGVRARHKVTSLAGVQTLRSSSPSGPSSAETTARRAPFFFSWGRSIGPPHMRKTQSASLWHLAGGHDAKLVGQVERQCQALTGKSQPRRDTQACQMRGEGGGNAEVFPKLKYSDVILIERTWGFIFIYLFFYSVTWESGMFFFVVVFFPYMKCNQPHLPPYGAKVFTFVFPPPQ